MEFHRGSGVIASHQLAEPDDVQVRPYQGTDEFELVYGICRSHADGQLQSSSLVCAMGPSASADAGVIRIMPGVRERSCVTTTGTESVADRYLGVTPKETPRSMCLRSKRSGN